MSSTRSFFFMQIKVIFIRMVSHLDSLWNRGARELGNGLLVHDKIYILHYQNEWWCFLLVWCHQSCGLFKEYLEVCVINRSSFKLPNFSYLLTLYLKVQFVDKYSKFLLSHPRPWKRCSCTSQKQILPVLAMMLTFLTKRWQCCKSSISPFNLSSIMSISAISRQIPCQIIQSHFLHVKPHNTVQNNSISHV